MTGKNKAPYGFRRRRRGESGTTVKLDGLTRTDLVAVPAEMAVIGRIRELRREGSLGYVSDVLEQEGLRTRLGRKWSRQRLHQICRQHDI